MTQQKADYILKGTAIFTGNDDEPKSGCVLIKGNRILKVVPLERMTGYVDENTTVINCGDHLIMPGFNDSHMHISLGSVQNDPDFCIQMMDCKSEEECVQMVKDFAASHPDNPWIYGTGWYSEVWDNPHTPSKKSLDALNLDRPICLNSFDLHSVWCNQVALDKIGITKDTPNPQGGIYGHDDDGELNGILYEPPATKAMMDEVLNVPTLKQSLLKCLKHFRELGMTSVADVYPSGLTNDNIPEIFDELEQSGELTTRISSFPSLTDVKGALELKKKYHTDKHRVAGLKQVLDGVVEAHTALLSKPYDNDPGVKGDASLTQDELNKYVLEAQEAGLPVKIHAIGDQASTMALDAYQYAQNKFGKLKLHNSIEHIDMIRQDDIDRLKKLNVMCCVQPQHCTGDFMSGGYLPCIGEERLSHTWPYREILDAGNHLGFGSDFPAVYSVNPMWTIYAAVTRCEPNEGKPDGGYFHEHAVTLAEALRAHTKWSAYAESFEDDLGTLDAGKLADVIVLDRNLFKIDPMDIRYAKVDLTISDGKIVYKK
ncbi:amidohydrolase [Lactobacillus sp. ESL0677]|uniref:amidohydrolase n=1 Tax=Lactobacillus sp. ESL0677 TaxID=2983208 RepID=UPI0023F903DF|nr:amidohydrolase [Lactobacillus sp. ESL0677]WEV36192.1 amidohydrolase [Lactobacillus sp. ESL0677]